MLYTFLWMTWLNHSVLSGYSGLPSCAFTQLGIISSLSIHFTMRNFAQIPAERFSTSGTTWWLLITYQERKEYEMMLVWCGLLCWLFEISASFLKRFQSNSLITQVKVCWGSKLNSMVQTFRKLHIPRFDNSDRFPSLILWHHSWDPWKITDNGSVMKPTSSVIPGDEICQDLETWAYLKRPGIYFLQSFTPRAVVSF